MRALIVSLGDWQGPARLPKSLKGAGWEVATFCRKGYAAAKTRFVDHFFFVNPRGEIEIMRDLIQAIKTWQPTVILPGMETATTALAEIWRLHSLGKMQVDDDVIAAIRRSIIDPSAHHFLYSKIDLLEAMAQRGVKIPPQRELHTFGDADAFVQEHGYPVIVKPDWGYAGSGIAICYDEEKLLTALQKRLKPGSNQRWCIQRYMEMMTALCPFAAKDGKYLTGSCLFRMETNPHPTGSSTVVRVVKNEQMTFGVKTLIELTGYNGVGAVQFMVEDEGKGEAAMIETNFRMGVSTHLGKRIGADVSQALYNAFAGLPIEPANVEEGLTIAFWPAEVLRKPDSEYLKGVVDYVEDDPELFAHFEKQIEDQLGARA